MKKSLLVFTMGICLIASTAFIASKTKDGWVSLFDGKTLNNWKVGDNAATFSVANGMIVVHGSTAHLFYEGDVNQHNFKNNPPFWCI